MKPPICPFCDAEFDYKSAKSNRGTEICNFFKCRTWVGQKNSSYHERHRGCYERQLRVVYANLTVATKALRKIALQTSFHSTEAAFLSCKEIAREALDEIQAGL